METIKTYLDNLFLQLPKTPEVLRAKEELLEMMEDKYEELKAQGKAEHEVIGTVISEFGNLNEILEELEIKETQQQKNAERKDAKNEENWSKSDTWEEMPECRRLSFDEVREFLKFRSLYAVMIGLGVALCILSPIGLILCSGGPGSVLGFVQLFLFLAIAVGLFIFFGIQSGKYEDLSKEVFSLDELTEGILLEQSEEKRSAFAILLVLGVAFCILSVIPVIVLEELGTGLEDTVGPALLLVFVAIGVFFLVYAGISKGSYTVLLQKEEYSRKKKWGKKKRKKLYDAISSCYWGCVTIFYFLWSFTRRNWAYSWIVFVVAGLFWGMIESIWDTKDK